MEYKLTWQMIVLALIYNVIKYCKSMLAYVSRRSYCRRIMNFALVACSQNIGCFSAARTYPHGGATGTGGEGKDRKNSCKGTQDTIGLNATLPIWETWESFPGCVHIFCC